MLHRSNVHVRTYLVAASGDAGPAFLMEIGGMISEGLEQDSRYLCRDSGSAFE